MTRLEKRLEWLKNKHTQLHEECERNPSDELKKQKLVVKHEISNMEWAELYRDASNEH